MKNIALFLTVVTLFTSTYPMPNSGHKCLDLMTTKILYPVQSSIEGMPYSLYSKAYEKLEVFHKKIDEMFLSSSLTLETIEQTDFEVLDKALIRCCLNVNLPINHPTIRYLHYFLWAYKSYLEPWDFGRVFLRFVESSDAVGVKFMIDHFIAKIEDKFFGYAFFVAVSYTADREVLKLIFSCKEKLSSLDKMYFEWSLYRSASIIENIKGSSGINLAKKGPGSYFEVVLNYFKDYLNKISCDCIRKTINIGTANPLFEYHCDTLNNFLKAKPCCSAHESLIVVNLCDKNIIFLKTEIQDDEYEQVVFEG